MTPQELYQIIQKQPINSGLQKFLFIQAMFETGHLKSSLYLKNNNLYGMTYVGQKLANGYTTSTSTYDGKTRKWAKYDNVENSILDRIRLAKVKKYADLHDFSDIFDAVIEGCYIGCPPNPKELENYKRNMYTLRIEYSDILDNPVIPNTEEPKKTEIGLSPIIVPIILGLILAKIFL